MTDQSEISRLLQHNVGGLDRLIPLVYDELRRIARRQLGGERTDHTLDTNALVHEAYLKLSQLDRIEWRGRAHFMAGRSFKPDVVFSHSRDDRHQDHRVVSDLTWNTFRQSLVLEYEVPKWDGDLGRPNCYVALTPAVMQRKTALLLKHFASQRSKDWFDARTFEGLARLRGVECRAPGGFAEAFHARKWLLGL